MVCNQQKTELANFGSDSTLILECEGLTIESKREMKVLGLSLFTAILGEHIAKIIAKVLSHIVSHSDLFVETYQLKK